MNATNGHGGERERERDRASLFALLFVAFK